MKMLLLKIFKIDDNSQDKPISTLSVGEHIIGRGPLLECHDKRVSRKHAIIEVQESGATIKAAHVNPCFYMSADSKKVIVLPKDDVMEISDGDKFAFLSDIFWYMFKMTNSDCKGFAADTQSSTSLRESTSTSTIVSDAAVVRTKSPSKRPSENSEITENAKRFKPVDVNLDKLLTDIESIETQDFSNSNVDRNTNTSHTGFNNNEEPANLGNMDETGSENERKDGKGVKQGNSKTSGYESSDDVDYTKLPNSSSIQSIPSSDENGIRGNENKIAENETEINQNQNAQNCSTTILKDEVLGQSTKNIECGDENIKECNLQKSKNKPLPHKRIDQDQDIDEKLEGVKQEIEESVIDEDTPGASINQTSTNTSSSTSRREQCWYGGDCYRKSSSHRSDFSHPGDSDHDPHPNDDRPSCSFGESCYRTNLLHRRDYKHSGKPAAKPQRKPKRKVAKKGSSCSLDDSEEDFDPYGGGSSSSEASLSDYEVDSDSSDSQEMEIDSQELKRTIKEAKKFTKRFK